MSADNYITIHNHPGPNGGYCWVGQSASADVENEPALDYTRFDTIEDAVRHALNSLPVIEYGFQFRLADYAEDWDK